MPKLGEFNIDIYRTKPNGGHPRQGSRPEAITGIAEKLVYNSECLDQFARERPGKPCGRSTPQR